MPQMADPNIALVSFQREFGRKNLSLQKCETRRDMFVHLDEPAPGKYRFTYALHKKGVVYAIGIMTPSDPYEGEVCFQIGAAVAEAERGKGYFREIMRSTLLEFKNGMSKTIFKGLYVESIVDADNAASLKVTSEFLGDYIKESVESLSGRPARQFMIWMDLKGRGKLPFE